MSDIDDRIEGVESEESEEIAVDPLALVLGSPAKSGRGGRTVVEVTQIWGDAVLAARKFGLGQRVVLGPNAGGDVAFVAPDLAGRHVLVAPEDGVPTVEVPDGWTLERAIDGHSEAIEARSATLPSEGALLLRNGDVCLVVREATDARRVSAALTQGIDWGFAAVSAAALGLAGIAAASLAVVPAAPQAASVDIEDRIAVAEFFQPKEPSRDLGSKAGARAKHEEGARKGDEAAKASGTKRARSDAEEVAESGVFAAFDGELSAMLGDGTLSSEITAGVGSLVGNRGTSIGAGFGRRGSGIGGGGVAEGIGGIGTRGPGSGDVDWGSGDGQGFAKGQGDITQVGGDPIILGALDRSLIDEVVKQHMNQIRYCYQRELTKDADLAGKVVIKFTIARDGSVSSADTRSTTMHAASVEQCIEGRFVRMQFPQPKGGGIVVVSYPFLFSPG